MKAIVILSLALIYFTACLEFLSGEPHLPKASPIESIVPGMGFSSDSQSLGRAVCYHPETTNRSGQSSVLHFEESMDYSKLINTFNLEASLNGGYGIFSGNGMLNYIRSLEESDYAMSLNYFQRVSHSVLMTYAYNPATILSEIGKNIYSDGKNGMFRLLCGDTLITAYEEGAALIFSMKVHFTSKEDKKTFKAKVGLNVGSFVSASPNISKTAEQLRINGRIEISAFQMGGDPALLAKILSSSIVDCDIRTITACQDTAKTLLNYASTNFPSQFQKDPNGSWSGPLVPVTQFKKDFKVTDIGLSLPPSYVTKEVELARNDLIALYRKFKYYASNMQHITEFYPVLLPEIFLRKLQSIKDNVNILYAGNSVGTKAFDCFEFPFKCKAVHDELLESVNLNIESEIMALIKGLKNLSVFRINLTNNMCLPDSSTWDKVRNAEMYIYPTSETTYELKAIMPNYYNFKSFTIKDFGNFSIFAYVNRLSGEILNYEFNVATSKTSDTSFAGLFRCFTVEPKVNQKYNITGVLMNNPFYFEKYVP